MQLAVHGNAPRYQDIHYPVCSVLRTLIGRNINSANLLLKRLVRNLTLLFVGQETLGAFPHEL